MHFNCNDYFVLGKIRTCLRGSSDPMVPWISSNSHSLNLLLVLCPQANVIIVKRLNQGRNNVTRVRVESRLCNQGPRKNDAPSISATLPTISSQAQTIAVFDLIRGQTLYSICPISNPSQTNMNANHLVLDLVEVKFKN